MIIDAHHHLWDLSAVHYPWLMARGERRFFGDPTPIQRDYLAEAFRADWDGLPVVGSVHVQVGAAPGEEVKETAFAAHEAERAGVPSAIVAFADLRAFDLDTVLDAHAAAAGGRLRGVRQIVSRHPEEDAKNDAPALLDDPAFLEGLREVAARGLSFDLQLSAPYLEKSAELMSRVDGLKVALCHVGSPWDRSADGLARWRRGLAAIAALPGSTAKLSGFGMFDHDWTTASIRPLVEGVLEAFGPERTMWGSNFPVDKLHRPYRALYEAVAECVPAAHHPQVFAGTARAFYRI